MANHPPPAARPAHPDRAADARPEVRPDAHPGPGRGPPRPRRPARRAYRPDPGSQLRAQTTLRHYLDNPVVGLGPTLTPQLRDHLTGFHRPAGWNGVETHPHEAVLLASINHRPASPIPPGALDPVIALYQAAAHPLTPAPTPPPGPARRLAAVPTPVAAAPVTGHPTIRKGPRL